jgi:hypothetical protein
VVQITHSWDTFDRFADAPNAIMQIRCQRLPCSSKIEEQSYRIVLGSELECEFTPDVPAAVLEAGDAELFCMPVAAYEDHATGTNVFDGLVLARTNLGTYQRLGLVEGVLGRWLNENGHECIIFE